MIFKKITLESDIVLPVYKNFRTSSAHPEMKGNFSLHILIFPAMYATLVTIENWINMFAETLFPDII